MVEFGRRKLKKISMSRLCDLCGQACKLNNYLSLSAWWTKHFERVDTIKKKSSRVEEEVEVFEPKLLSGEERLTADICRECVENRLAKSIRFHPRITRMTILEDCQKENPNKHPLECMRKTAKVIIEAITCDICHKDCFSKHLLCQSEWMELSHKKWEAHREHVNFVRTDELVKNGNINENKGRNTS
jgi:hypothetical protein